MVCHYPKFSFSYNWCREIAADDSGCRWADSNAALVTCLGVHMCPSVLVYIKGVRLHKMLAEMDRVMFML